MIPKRTYLYVIGVSGSQRPVKVGISTTPDYRLKTFQSGCPLRLELFHAQPMRDRNHALWHELNFHDVWAEWRLYGEWFDTDPEVAIESIETALFYEAN